MSKPTIRTIFVDYGNVCATFDFHRFINGLSSMVGVTPECIREVLCEREPTETGHWGYSPLFAALECGEIKLLGFYHILLRALNQTGRIDYFAFERLWTDILLKENKALGKLLGKLPQQKYLLSNTNKVFYERNIAESNMIAEHFPLTQQILSFKVGAIKPDPVIYKVALAQAKASPEESLFIDDMPENIEAWRELGGHGIVYHAGKDSIRKLKKELRALGALN